jgi:hypothetical protein
MVDKYKNLSRKDLNHLIKKLEYSLVQAKENLDNKNNTIKETLKTYNWDKLELVLKNENDFDLSEEDWAILDFKQLTSKDLNFFINITQLNSFRYYDENNSSYSSLTKTQEAIYASFKDKLLFDFFSSKNEYIPLIKIMAEDYGINPLTDPLVIDALVQKNLLNFDNDLLNKVINEQCFNYLEYFLKHDIYNLKDDDYKKIYLENWSKMPTNFIATLKNKYTEYQSIPLYDLIKIFTPSIYSKDEDMDRMKSLLKEEESTFLRVIEEHTTNAYDIDTLMEAFQDTSPKNNGLLHKFIGIVVHKKPEHIPHLRRFPCSLKNPEFMYIFNKSLDYIDIEMSLDKKLPITSKKIKM